MSKSRLPVSSESWEIVDPAYKLSMKCSERVPFKTESTEITVLCWKSMDVVTEREGFFQPVPEFATGKGTCCQSPSLSFL